MIARSLFEYLVNTLWQLPLLAAATWLIIRVSRPALFLQHVLWCAALAAAVLLPLRGIDWSQESFTPAPIARTWEPTPYVSKSAFSFEETTSLPAIATPAPQ